MAAIAGVSLTSGMVRAGESPRFVLPGVHGRALARLLHWTLCSLRFPAFTDGSHGAPGVADSLTGSLRSTGRAVLFSALRSELPGGGTR
jgi:hypothetical protein